MIFRIISLSIPL